MLTNERTGGQDLIPLVEQIEAKTEGVVEEVSGSVQARLNRGGKQSLYRLRARTVEPVSV